MVQNRCSRSIVAEQIYHLANCHSWTAESSFYQRCGGGNFNTLYADLGPVNCATARVSATQHTASHLGRCSIFLTHNSLNISFSNSPACARPGLTPIKHLGMTSTRRLGLYLSLVLSNTFLQGVACLLTLFSSLLHLHEPASDS
jgi:hypothetical protein